jgi:hypothetical protein
MEALAVLAAITMATEARLEADLRCLPPAQVVRQSLAFYNAHDAWLDYEEQVCPCKALQKWRCEHETYGAMWCLLSAAQDCSKSLANRLRIVAKLKMQLGLQAFYSGQMPSPPVRYFKEGRPFKQQMDFLSHILGAPCVGYVY